MNAREAQAAGRRDAPERRNADELGYVSRRRAAPPGQAAPRANAADANRAEPHGGRIDGRAEPPHAGGARRDAHGSPAAQYGRQAAPRQALRAHVPQPAAPRAGRARRATPAARRRRRVWRSIGSWIVTLALAALVGLGVRGFVFELVRVEGPSMHPTLESGEVLLVTRFDYLSAKPARGDVVVCRYPNREGTFVKRVIALPGEAFEIRDGSAYIDGEQLVEDYVEFAADEDYGPVLIGDGQYMLLGDNRPVSHDSRAGDVGTLRADDIVGRVRWVVYPFDAARDVTG